MSRTDEIAQGLRDESGSLTFPLDILEYSQGHEDYRTGHPPPDGLTSPSYDLGRARAAKNAEETAELMGAREAEDRRRQQALREMLKDRPDVLAQYDAAMEAIDRARDPSPFVNIVPDSE